MLDDANVLKQRDPQNALAVAAAEYAQTEFDALVWNEENDGRQLLNIVVAGMGGSALAALLLKAWLKADIKIPVEVLRSYDLPAYVGPNTLVIASSYSGNTEETVSALEQAEVKGAQLGIIAASGKLIDEASSNRIAHVQLPENLQPRMAVIYNLRALVSLLVTFGIVDRSKFDEIKNAAGWLKDESSKWLGDVPTDDNYAKQLAGIAVGKTPVFYGGTLTAPVAYKWKISWNENAKNVAFWNEYSEFNHNEFMGWTEQPEQKPYTVIDLRSQLEHPQIQKRFEISARLLSGRRPEPIIVEAQGETLLEQLLSIITLGDFVTLYTALLSNVNPTPVALIEKLKQELV